MKSWKREGFLMVQVIKKPVLYHFELEWMNRYFPLVTVFSIKPDSFIKLISELAGDFVMLQILTTSVRENVSYNPNRS